MEGREQKILKNNCPQAYRAELDTNAGVQTYIWIDETESTKGELNVRLLEQILSPHNLNNAYLQVTRNQGSSGIDKMEVKELKNYLLKHKTELINSILTGKYKPTAVRSVEIPKDNGKKRKLGIPTVIDRLIQQSIHQILSPIYERQFSPYSYGFRPQRSAHEALKKSREYINSGYNYVADIDLEKYFDTVHRSKLIELLSRTIKDGRVISLIHKFLNSGVSICGIVEEREKGVPQGSPLSPLLGNIMLHELDKELTLRGHKYVRYADDIMIFCKSRRGGERVLESVIRFLEGKLYLRVNREKTVLTEASKVKFLGYSYYKIKDVYRFRLHPQSLSKMKIRIRELTSRSNGKGDAWRKTHLKYFIIGWLNYYKLADMKSILRDIDAWYRCRLRMVIWKQWKLVKTRFTNLQLLGISRRTAWEHANTRKGYWHTAHSWILSVPITNERLKRAGYIFFSDYYQKVAPLY
jgi:group II intron reverse transcriptase/maturase